VNGSASEVRLDPATAFRHTLKPGSPLYSQFLQRQRQPLLKMTGFLGLLSSGRESGSYPSGQ
jgi:hypothetical protein